MLVVICYDVATTEEGGQRRLRKIAKTCKNYGQRVQFSVFECEVDPAQWAVLRQRLIEKIDPETDSLRFYFLGAKWKKRVEQVGVKKSYDPDEPMIV
ncbi:MAG: CRISPR-associated endonuclease Cas2 [Deltaproteobacteria bacterium]|nr:CRISPR-associated endonuclease Cas2 [Deltaproteobacteria bacterium]